MEQDIRLLDIHQVRERVNLAEDSIYVRVRAGTFPRPLKLSPKCARWRSDEIEKWIADLPRGGNLREAA